MQKPVRCIETGEIFASESLAARAKNINQTAISNCCIHKVVKSKGYVYETHTAGGYHWEFYKKEGD